VYNAAVLRPGRASALPPEQLTSDFLVNVAGALVAVQTVLPAMRQRGSGTILLTGGGLALNPSPELASLAIGKAGIRSLAYSLFQELKPQRIHAATVTICGTVQDGTHFSAERIAEEYVWLHRQEPDNWTPEVIYDVKIRR
jgi:short-subunit dehydrogenase